MANTTKIIETFIRLLGLYESFLLFLETYIAILASIFFIKYSLDQNKISLLQKETDVRHLSDNFICFFQ
ncbi:MAG: hypothetical protein EAZ97_16160 [Bacteroidetes bacterium]|nr:MAG: hypothetical protein EAZ97_16160 [Bacteroidota bacterium]